MVLRSNNNCDKDRARLDLVNYAPAVLARDKMGCCRWILPRSGPKPYSAGHPCQIPCIVPLNRSIASPRYHDPALRFLSLTTAACGNLTGLPVLAGGGRQRHPSLLGHSLFGLYQVVRVFTENSSFIGVDNNLPLHDGCPALPFKVSGAA